MTNEEQQKKYEKMTQTPVGRLMLSLAVPTIISMLVSAIYNMADTYFVTKIGTSASGAVGVVFSIMTVFQAIGFTFGQGSATWVARLLGGRENEKANMVAASGFYAALACGVILSVVGLIFQGDIMTMLGATETILPYAKEYGQYIFLAAPVMIGSFVMNNLLRFEGMAKFSMIGIAAGGVLNIFLDPIFIFRLGLGTAGAAIATALSQCVSFLLLISVYLRKKSAVSLNIRNISHEAGIYLQIIKNGLPSFCRQGMASIANISLNRAAGIYGDPAIAAMAIVAKVMWLMYSVLIGFGQGYQPVVSFNYGANRFDRSGKACAFMLKCCIGIGTVFAIFGCTAAPAILNEMIGYDAEAVKIGIFALRAQALTLPLIPVGVTCNMSYQSTGQAWIATFLSMLRQGICFLPAILILPAVLGLRGVQLAQAASDTCTFLIGIPFIVRFFRHLEKKQRETEEGSK